MLPRGIIGYFLTSKESQVGSECFAIRKDQCAVVTAYGDGLPGRVSALLDKSPDLVFDAAPEAVLFPRSFRYPRYGLHVKGARWTPL